MTSSEPPPGKRNSRALEAVLITDPTERAQAEARNGLRQYDVGIQAAFQAIERGAFKLRPSLVLTLHREALQGISSFAGNYRPAGVEIQGSRHEPPPAHLVPELVEDMWDYVNDGLGRSDALAPRGLYHVATELDSPLRRWQWPYLPNHIVCRAVRSRGVCLPGYADHPRSDRQQSSALFRCVRCGRRGLEGRASQRLADGNLVRRAFRFPVDCSIQTGGWENASLSPAGRKHNEPLALNKILSHPPGHCAA